MEAIDKTLEAFGYTIPLSHFNSMSSHGFGGFSMEVQQSDAQQVLEIFRAAGDLGKAISTYIDISKKAEGKSFVDSLRRMIGLNKSPKITRNFLDQIMGNRTDACVVYGSKKEHRKIVKKSRTDIYNLAEETYLDMVMASEFIGLLQRRNVNVKERIIDQLGYRQLQRELRKNITFCSGGIGKDNTAKELYKHLPIHTMYDDPLHSIKIDTGIATSGVSRYEKYAPKYSKNEYTYDIGIIALSRRSPTSLEYNICTFGAHAYGTLAAGKSITLGRGVPIWKSNTESIAYSIKEISEEPIKALTEVVSRYRPSVCYAVIKAELSEGKIERIIPYYDRTKKWGPFWY